MIGVEKPCARAGNRALGLYLEAHCYQGSVLVVNSPECSLHLPT